MKLKKLLNIPIILSGMLVMLPGNYLHHKHHQVDTSALKTENKFTSGTYGKYLENMNKFQNQHTFLTSSGQSYQQPLLGYGYDLATHRVSPENAFENYEKAKVKIIPLDSTYDFSYISNESDLSVDLGISASCHFGFKHFGISGGASFKHAVDESVSSVKLSFRMKTDVIELFDYNNGATLKDSARALLDNKNTKAFFNNYDDKYVVRLYATREVVFNLNINISSYSVSQQVKGKSRFSNKLGDLAAALAFAAKHGDSKTTIQMNTLSLPKNQFNAGAITNISQIGDIKSYLSNLQTKAANYVNLTSDQKSNPSNYFAKGIEPYQLDDYSYYYNKPTQVVSPFVNILPNFGALNQYYDLYENMSQDLNKLNLFNKCTCFDTTGQTFDLGKRINNYVLNFKTAFSDDNPNLISFFNGDITPLKTQLTNYSQQIFNSQNFSYDLRMLDWFEHLNNISIFQNKKVVNNISVTNKEINSKNVGITFNFNNSITLNLNQSSAITKCETINFKNYQLKYENNLMQSLFLPSKYQFFNIENGIMAATDILKSDNYIVWNDKTFLMRNIIMERQDGNKTKYQLNIFSQFGSDFSPDAIFLHTTT